MTTILAFPSQRDRESIDRMACSVCRNKTFLVLRERPTGDWAVVCPVCENQLAADFILLETENPRYIPAPLTARTEHPLPLSWWATSRRRS